MAGERSRMAWRAAGSLFAIAALVFGTANVVSALAHQVSRLHRDFAGPVRVIDVHAETGGTISVVGEEGAEGVSLDMVLSRGLEAPSHTEVVDGDRLVVRSRCFPVLNSFCQVDYTIRVPRDVAVRADSGGGNVRVSGVRGDLDLTASGGDLSVQDVRAEHMRLDSSGGDIVVAASSADVIDASGSGGGVDLSLSAPPTSVNVNSSGGDIVIEVPNTSDAYRVSLDSSGGEALTRVRTDPASSRVIRASASGGDVVVRYPG